MLIPAETLQQLVNRQVAEQRQQEQIQRAVNAGDEHAAWFYSQKPEIQQNLLARQDIGDAVEAARSGDAPGTRQGITSAVNRVIYQGATLGNPRAQRQPPRRKRGR